MARPHRRQHVAGIDVKRRGLRRQCGRDFTLERNDAKRQCSHEAFLN